MTSKKRLHLSTLGRQLRKSTFCSTDVYHWLPAFRRFSRHFHPSVQDHTVTDNIITISPCSPFLTVTKNSITTSSFFQPELFVVRSLESWSDFSLALSRKHQTAFHPLWLLQLLPFESKLSRKITRLLITGSILLSSSCLSKQNPSL